MKLTSKLNTIIAVVAGTGIGFASAIYMTRPEHKWWCLFVFLGYSLIAFLTFKKSKSFK